MRTVSKKISAVLLAFLMVIGMTATAMAAGGNGSITINGKEGQSLKGKQFAFHRILNATVAGSGDSVKIAYTLNEDYTAILQAVTKKTTEEEIIKYIGDLRSEDAYREFADDVREAILDAVDKGTLNADSYLTRESDQDESFTVSELSLGYYLVDELNRAGGAASLCMLNTTLPDANIDIKSDYPTVKKKVMDEDYDDAGFAEIYGEGFNDAADYDIGDEIPFAFYSAVPQMNGYDKYDITFYDKLSDGLDFVDGSLKVTIGGRELPEGTGGYHWLNSDDLQGKEASFGVAIPELNKIEGIEPGEQILIQYKAKLNQDAVIGIGGNPNEVWLEYSADPYSEEKKETEKDKVVVFTFGIQVNKVDRDSGTTGSSSAVNPDTKTKLAGAKFKLFKGATDEVEIKLTHLGDSTYVVDEQGQDTITSDGQNKIYIKGLDSGSYLLKETEAPDGYNKLKEPIEVVVTAVYAEQIRQTWTGLTTDIITALNATANGESIIVQDWLANLVVENASGKELPETGGMGTILFTAGGTVLMAGAAVVFMRTRRKEEK